LIKSLLKRTVLWWHRSTAKDALSDIALKKGDVAIDCGANVGNVTARMASKGATVYAFEPNPYAYNVLSQRFSNATNVHCINKGMLDRDGGVRLYLHENAEEDQVMWSTGSSILAYKGNINKERSVEIEIIDIADFISELGVPVKVLKIDVEGVECALINRLIDTGIIKNIQHALVETHDHKIPELREETDRLRKVIAEKGLTNINLDWV